ncbi:MAG: hypothetical protein WCQ26_13490 [Pseudanabaena sp. ELA748]
MNKSFLAQVVTPPPDPPKAQISMSIEQIMLLGAGFVCTATIGLVRWFVVRSIHQHETTVNGIKEKNDGLRKDLSMQQRELDQRLSEIDRRFVELSTKFVNKEDYLRHQTITEAKLDAIHRRFDELMAIIISKQNQ